MSTPVRLGNRLLWGSRRAASLSTINSPDHQPPHQSARCTRAVLFFSDRRRISLTQSRTPGGRVS